MRLDQIGSLPTDELWRLYEQLTVVLREKIAEEKIELERRLAVLSGSQDAPALVRRTRRPRLKFHDEGATQASALPAKYCNTAAPHEVWSGRGRRPRWLIAALRAGGDLEQFVVIGKGGDPGAYAADDAET